VVEYGRGSAVVRKVILGNDEEVIKTYALTKLREKERAHDAYLKATQSMGRSADRARHYSEGMTMTEHEEWYYKGWMGCLQDFSHRVVMADRGDEMP
jgi:hypothetical protein